MKSSQNIAHWAFSVVCKGELNNFIKTKNANRKVPVHDKLVELGFLDYLESTRAESLRLFPCLKKTDNTYKYGIKEKLSYASTLTDKELMLEIMNEIISLRGN